MQPRFIPAFLLTFVNVLGFSLLIPVLPFVVEQYGSSETVYGLLLSLYSLCQFLAAPWLGRLSDSYGRKPILMISQAGTLLSWLFLVSLGSYLTFPWDSFHCHWLSSRAQGSPMD